MKATTVPLTAPVRQQIRAARDQAVRERVAAETERQRISCACRVCLRLVACAHGASAGAKYGCKHPVSREARAAAKRLERAKAKA